MFTFGKADPVGVPRRHRVTCGATDDGSRHHKSHDINSWYHHWLQGYTGVLQPCTWVPGLATSSNALVTSSLVASCYQ